MRDTGFCCMSSPHNSKVALFDSTQQLGSLTVFFDSLPSWVARVKLQRGHRGRWVLASQWMGIAHSFKSPCVLKRGYPSSSGRVFLTGISGCVFPLCSSNRCYKFTQQAKESWEMDTKEKLEQAAIVKEKGTVYFKVCESLYSLFHFKEFVQVVSDLCSYSLLWIISAPFWGRVSLNFYKSAISSVRNGEKEWINVTKRRQMPLLHTLVCNPP